MPGHHGTEIGLGGGPGLLMKEQRPCWRAWHRMRALGQSSIIVNNAALIHDNIIVYQITTNKITICCHQYSFCKCLISPPLPIFSDF